MRISGTTGAVAALIALAAAGGGTFFFKNVQSNRKLELEKQIQEAKLKVRAEDAKAKEAEARAKEAEAKKAEADRLRADAEAEAKQTDLAAKKQEAVNQKEKAAAAEAEAKRAEAVKAAAEAETAKAQAAKVEAEARIAAEAKRAETEKIALARAEAEQKKSEADLAEKLAVKKIADAALAKSENELKTAEANASAEHDRKLRLYARANTSRAELLALKRAEKLLALEENGMLEQLGDVNDSDEDASAADTASATNAVADVKWPAPFTNETKADAIVAESSRKIGERFETMQREHARRHIDRFSKLAADADADSRRADAQYYRSTLVTLVPDYVEEYGALVDEARHAEKPEIAVRRLCELLELVPEWQRVSVFVRLVRRDETYYSRELAGRVSKDEYVKTFRKIYDEARRDKGDRDERDAKIAHICKVLAAYVPDYEQSPEWK